MKTITIDGMAMHVWHIYNAGKSKEGGPYVIVAYPLTANWKTELEPEVSLEEEVHRMLRDELMFFGPMGEITFALCRVIERRLKELKK